MSCWDVDLYTNSKQAWKIMQFREPAPMTNERTAFYNVTDVMQAHGLRDRPFDSIVLQCSGAGKFQKYAVFSATDSESRSKSAKTAYQQWEQQQQHQAIFIYYDALRSKFWSDAMYHNYEFDASMHINSTISAHIANEKFKFYISYDRQ